MVIAHHLMWTAYGWWLPNDPRGSTSKAIASDLIAELGKLHGGRKRVQPASSDIRAFYGRAQDVLRSPLLAFKPTEFAVLAAAFSATVQKHRYACYAAVFMPDHTHLVIRKHKHQAEEMIERFQEESREELVQVGLRPLGHPVWALGGWKVFLDHPDGIRRTIKYVEDNPIKWRLPRQAWSFVTPYNGWPLHPGHSPHSPYARRLRQLE